MFIEVHIVVLICLVIVFLKSIIIGSSFEFIMWFRDGSNYLEWYRSRPKYQPKLKNAKHVTSYNAQM
jgi:hypothetical protein